MEDEDPYKIPDNDRKYPYKHINTNSRYWIGDPFLVDDGGVFLFVEQFDRYKSKAYVSVKQLFPEEGELKPIYEFDAHSSYPCIFKWEDEYYIVPESGARKKLSLLHCINFPYKWEEKSILDEGTNYADCTVFDYNGKLYIFLYERLFPKTENVLYVADLNVESGKIENKREVKKYLDNNGRPGGKVFIDNLL